MKIWLVRWEANSGELYERRVFAQTLDEAAGKVRCTLPVTARIVSTQEVYE